MNNSNISKKILYWYDNNKRILPWRNYNSDKQKKYFTLVSEFMLQQTQVKTVIPFFENFIKKIPNLESLAKVNDKKLMKCWEGLGYYSRARNLKKSAKLIFFKFHGRIPKTIQDLKKLPGIGDYTSRAIMAIGFNKPIIPLDGNVERIIKRALYLKSKKEVSRENLNKEIDFFGISKRSDDYAQAIMEIGALICKPINPLCLKCPISKNCTSFKKNDFKIKSKSKFNKIKYYQAEVYENNKKFFLIKNNKFNFLKNLFIFPMTEIKKKKFNSSFDKKINIKISNLNMKILISRKNKKIKIKSGHFLNLNKQNIGNEMIPSFTKKIYKSILNYQ